VLLLWLDSVLALSADFAFRQYAKIQEGRRHAALHLGRRSRHAAPDEGKTGMNDPVDVLIIGAGASGAAVALSLANTKMQQPDPQDPPLSRHQRERPASRSPSP